MNKWFIEKPDIPRQIQWVLVHNAIGHPLSNELVEMIRHLIVKRVELLPSTRLDPYAYGVDSYYNNYYEALLGNPSPYSYAVTPFLENDPEPPVPVVPRNRLDPFAHGTGTHYAALMGDHPSYDFVLTPFLGNDRERPVTEVVKQNTRSQQREKVHPTRIASSRHDTPSYEPRPPSGYKEMCLRQAEMRQHDFTSGTIVGRRSNKKKGKKKKH